eukprot:TRINITY_DN11456_c0_g3_i2.p1 TRINITY_DN11456_c0_g3~~TRINITY_DN11456_c0_g3_i2.p1  ORF type:complete len:275 (-),score=43.56 TRINITY_DN11456_c0_g3_i2:213-962(-)
MQNADSEDYDSEEAAAEAPLVMDDRTGLPVMSQGALKKGWSQMTRMLPLFVLMPRLIGCGIAYLVYSLAGTEEADARMKNLNKLLMFNGELGYLYLAAGSFSLLVALQNNLPMLFKSQVMPGNAANLRSNMMIYKVNSQPKPPYVVMEEDGDIGRYNRANRALNHFVENTPSFALCVLMAGLIFPTGTFALVAVYAIARVWYQYAYATGGYGVGFCKHGVPFGVANILVFPPIEVLVWGIGVRMLCLHS